MSSPFRIPPRDALEGLDALVAADAARADAVHRTRNRRLALGVATATLLAGLAAFGALLVGSVYDRPAHVADHATFQRGLSFRAHGFVEIGAYYRIFGQTEAILGGDEGYAREDAAPPPAPAGPVRMFVDP